MSFLDNLENNLNALERNSQGDDHAQSERERREAERNAAVLRAPYAEALKSSSFTNEFLTQCRVVGHAARVLVRFTWIGDTLRLDAGPKRLELVPTPQGIAAVYSESGQESRRDKLDLKKANAATIAKRWLAA